MSNTFSLAIPNVYESIDRKVIHKIIRDLTAQNWLPEHDRLLVPHAIEKARTPGSTKSKKRGSRIAWQQNEVQILCNVEYEPGPDNIAAIDTMMEHIAPIFHDDNLKVTLKPYYDEVVYAMTLRVRSASRASLDLWARSVRLYSQRGLDRISHDVSYSFGMNVDTFKLLKLIHGLREEQYGYGDTLVEYIQHHSNNGMTVATSGDAERIEFTQRQLEVIGYFNVNPEPTISEVSEGLYEGRLVYSFTINRPIGITHDYPIMVHQQLIPHRYMDDVEKDYNNVIVHSPLMRAYTTYHGGGEKYATKHIPANDQWKGNMYPTGYLPVVTALIALDPETDILFNLNEMEDIVLDPHILRAFKLYWHSHLNDAFRCPFVITLHNDKHLLHLSYLEVDAALNVKLKDKLDLRSIYRVSLCITVNPNKVNPLAWTEIAGETEIRGVLAASINDAVNNGLDGAYGSSTNTYWNDSVFGPSDLSNYTGQSPYLINNSLIPNDISNYYYINTILPLINYPRGDTVYVGGAPYYFADGALVGYVEYAHWFDENNEWIGPVDEFGNPVDEDGNPVTRGTEPYRSSDSGLRTMTTVFTSCIRAHNRGDK